jgi:hypothetical protein
VRVRIRKLVPLKQSPGTRRQCARLLRAVVSSPPGAAASNRAKMDLEHLLIRMLNGDGVRSVERAMQAATIKVPLKLLRRKGARVWSGHDEAAQADLHIGITYDRLIKSALVSWLAVRPPPSPPTTRTHRLQAQFYERYNAVVKTAYADPPGRLSKDDTLLLRIAEFEADVNNGGFSQFMFNKGRRRARETVELLKTIRAPRTAAMLSTALAHPRDEALLGKLDGRFYEVPEDLAVKTMVKIGAGASTSNAPARAIRNR